MTIMQLYSLLGHLLGEGQDPNTLVHDSNHYVLSLPTLKVARANEFPADWEMPEGYRYLQFPDPS